MIFTPKEWLFLYRPTLILLLKNKFFKIRPVGEYMRWLFRGNVIFILVSVKFHFWFVNKEAIVLFQNCLINFNSDVHECNLIRRQKCPKRGSLESRKNISSNYNAYYRCFDRFVSSYDVAREMIHSFDINEIWSLPRATTP